MNKVQKEYYTTGWKDGWRAATKAAASLYYDEHNRDVAMTRDIAVQEADDLEVKVDDLQTELSSAYAQQRDADSKEVK